MTIENNQAAVAENAQVAEHKNVEETPRDYEAEARAQGWTPEAEWPADRQRPPKFLDAKAFVEKGEEIAPFIASNKKLRDELKALKKSVDDRVSKLANVNRANYEREVESYKNEITRLKAQQEKAVEEADVKEFRRLETEIGKVPVPTRPAADIEVDIAASDQATQEAEFAKNNTWYNTDEVATRFAKAYSTELARESGNKLPLADNLKMVEAKMRERFPQFYKKPETQANGHAAVDGGGSFPGSRQSDPILKFGNAEREQCKADMAKYPKTYPTSAAWIAAYQGKG